VECWTKGDQVAHDEHMWDELITGAPPTMPQKCKKAPFSGDTRLSQASLCG
jgi:hypothetical protein